MKKYDDEGIINLMTRMISNAKDIYVECIATSAYSSKRTVKEEYILNKKHYHSIEPARFVIKDPYSVFYPMTAEQIFKEWNEEAQVKVDQMYIKDQLEEKYSKITDLNTVIEELARDIIKYDFLNIENCRKLLGPVFKKGNVVPKGFKICKKVDDTIYIFRHLEMANS